MFSLPLPTLSAIMAQYQERVPEPLNRQFPERLPRDEAIKRQAERKRTRTELFPSGNFFVWTDMYLFLRRSRLHGKQKLIYRIIRLSDKLNKGDIYVVNEELLNCYCQLWFIVRLFDIGCFMNLFIAEDQESLQQDQTHESAGPPPKKKARNCSKCGRPMRGHPRGHCPVSEAAIAEESSLSEWSCCNIIY